MVLKQELDGLQPSHLQLGSLFALPEAGDGSAPG